MHDGSWIDAYLTRTERASFSRAVVTGYRYCEALMGSSPVLGNFAVGREQRPYIRRACVEHALTEMCMHTPTLWTELKQNLAKNCTHVVVRKGPLFVTAHHVDHPGQQARYARYREQLCSAHTGDLFAGRYGGVENELLRRNGGPLYLELVHTSDEDGSLRSIDFVLPMSGQAGVLAIVPLPFDSLPAQKVKPETVPEALRFPKRDQRQDDESNDEETSP